ncbi:MAG: orsellenic acid oxidase [Micromonosporaceae bacterium]
MIEAAGISIPTTGFDAASPDVQRDPYPYYHVLLRDDPVHRGAQGIWYVSRYADVHAVMSDPRFGRAGIRDFWASLVGPGPLSEILRHTLFFQDSPDHERLRGLLAPAFTPRAVRAMQPMVDRVVDDLLAPVLPRGEMDVVNDFAYPLALTVIARVLGIPAADRDRFREWTVGFSPTLDLAATPAEIERGHAAMGEFVDYLTALIARRRGAALDGLLGALLKATDDGARVSLPEVLSVVVTLAFAGHDTVTSLIGNGLLALIRHPDQLDTLRRRPDILPSAVAELLRYDSSVQSNSRLLNEDVELHGYPMRRGEVVVALIGAANRDPAQFEDPDRLDVTRTDVQPMSFGAGMRFCLGAILARMEAKAAFGRLIALTGIRLAVPADELVYHRSTMFRGVTGMPVRFTPQARPAVTS